MDEMDDIIKEFLVESRENLDQLDLDIVELEKDPAAKELVASIFRTIHSIKGATGFLGFEKLGAVAHSGESLLGRLRDGSLLLEPEITTALLALVDAIRKMLSEIERTGQEGGADYTALTDNLARLQDSASAAGAPATSALTPPPASPAPLPHAAPVRPAPEAQMQGAALAEVAPEAEAGASRPGPSSSLRIDVTQLDTLMNLVGELVLARNQILQMSSFQHDPEFLVASQQLNLVTSEIQEGVTKIRMQPIDSVWNKLPRLVRDLARQCGKQILLEMEGNETELDKSVLEAVKDPLTHSVRNAIDHGIETPEERISKGKAPQGLVRLRAFHENGQVNIEISDDGGGIDLSRVRQKALDCNLITPEQARLLDDHKTTDLLFLPGFSTAPTVTSVSGRGVGMDVVKTNIERIGGTVELHSKLGEGTVINLRIPLTLAIIPVVVIRCAGDRYAIPQTAIVELVRLDKMEAQKQINHLRETKIYRVRDRLLPLLFLDQELGVALPSGDSSSTELSDWHFRGAATIVALRVNDCHFALVVDEVLDTEEIVVRPLGKQVRNVSVYAGATILGDGRVALIIDVLGLARSCGVPNSPETTAASATTASGSEADAHNFLLVTNEEDQLMAISLNQVIRLEVFHHTQVEMAGSQRVLQYRGDILPLFSLSELLPERPGRNAREHFEVSSEEKIHVVICEAGGCAAGLVVGRVLDIEAYRQGPAAGVMPADPRQPIIMQRRVTKILDLDELLMPVASAWTRQTLALEVESLP